MSTPSIFSAIQKLRFLLTREDKLTWMGIVAFACVSAVLEVVTASLIVIFAQVLNQPETGQRYLGLLGFDPSLSPGRAVFYMALVVGLIYLVKNILAALEVFYQNFSIQRMNYHFKNKLLHRYAEADYAFYLTRNSSFGISVMNDDIERMFSVGMISLASLLSEGTVFLGLIMLIIAINPPLAFGIFCGAAVVGTLLSKWLLPQFYRWGQHFQESVLFAHQSLAQFFHGFKEIVLLGKKQVFVNSHQHYSARKTRVQALQTAINALPRMIIEVLFVGLFVVAIAFLCLEHESPVQMIGVLGGYLYAGFRLMPGLNRLINHLNTFKATVPFIERVSHEYDTVAVREHYVDVPDFSFQHLISLEGVTFRYPHTSKDVLQDVTLQIKKGECIGIVGETGSGKSTFVDLLLGLLKPSCGTILIDERYPVNSYQWHRLIGYVPQLIYLIDDTIKANIAFGEDPLEIDEYHLQKAIDAAQLRQLIDQLPQGVDTLVGERGMRLSGGERQRIAIARALYRNPEVLIFDEATSALDNETEARLMETVYAISQNRTVIMIAHRLTTLERCDRVIRVERGRCV